jgi:hypothetical protein
VAGSHPDLDGQEREALMRAYHERREQKNRHRSWTFECFEAGFYAALAAREEPRTGVEQKLRDTLADALLWLERIPPPEEEVRALGRGLWDETLENARALLAAREEPPSRATALEIIRNLVEGQDVDEDYGAWIAEGEDFLRKHGSAREDTERPAEDEYDEQRRVEAEAQAREP